MNDHVTDLEAWRALTFMGYVLERVHAPRYRIAIADESAEEDDVSEGDAVPGGTIAKVLPNPGRLSAMVWLCEDWGSIAPELRFHTLVHESMHILIRPLRDVMRHALGSGELVPTTMFEALRLVEDQAEELLCDHWANWAVEADETLWKRFNALERVRKMPADAQFIHNA